MSLRQTRKILCVTYCHTKVGDMANLDVKKNKKIKLGWLYYMFIEKKKNKQIQEQQLSLPALLFLLNW